MNKTYKIAFFGGEPLGVPVLEILKDNGLMPTLVVCSPDRPSGRKLALTPPPVKAWANKNHLPVFQPAALKDETQLELLTTKDWDLFVVVAYNHILPEWLIKLPKHKTINLHPSLLPKLRGPSPIRSAILTDQPESVGVSVMLMDKEMDHGPLLAQEKTPIDRANWPPPGLELDEQLARQGGELLAKTIPAWLNGEMTPTEQTHDEATYTKKLTKAMGQLDLDPLNLPTGELATQALLKIRGLDGWPGTFFFRAGKRVKINRAEIDSTGTLKPLSVTPEGKKEMSFADYLSQLATG